LRYAWPGNIRELRNLCERLALLLSSDMVSDERDLPALLPELYDAGNTLTFAPSALDALAQCGGDRSAAARYLGVSRTTFWRRLKEEQTR
jgi:Transcriptional regulator containing PAS, AAA-type ATPase, and DNA-binding domains